MDFSVKILHNFFEKFIYSLSDNLEVLHQRYFIILAFELGYIR